MRSIAAGASATASPSHATRRTASGVMSARVAIFTLIASTVAPAGYAAASTGRSSSA
jgi:hypothetical protein